MINPERAVRHCQTPLLLSIPEHTCTSLLVQSYLDSFAQHCAIAGCHHVAPSHD